MTRGSGRRAGWLASLGPATAPRPQPVSAPAPPREADVDGAREQERERSGDEAGRTSGEHGPTVSFAARWLPP